MAHAGKKIQSYDKMIERHKEICESITNLKLKLKIPLMEIDALEAELADLYQVERPLREKSTIDKGNRVLSVVDAANLNECESKINKGLQILNMMSIYDLDGRAIKFKGINDSTPI